MLVVTRDDVPSTYVDQLKEKRINYIQAGRGEHVDLLVTLDTRYQRGFRRLALTGGGKLNGTFLRAGLVDEVSVVIAPCIVGGNHTSSIFDCPNLTTLDGITRVRLIKSGQMGDEAFWLHYKVLW